MNLWKHKLTSFLNSLSVIHQYQISLRKMMIYLEIPQFMIVKWLLKITKKNNFTVPLIKNLWSIKIMFMKFSQPTCYHFRFFLINCSQANWKKLCLTYLHHNYVKIHSEFMCRNSSKLSYSYLIKMKCRKHIKQFWTNLVITSIKFTYHNQLNSHL